MMALLLALALSAQAAAWKTNQVALVLQHSGAQRNLGQAITTLLNRLLEDKPEAVEITLLGFDPKFKQIDGGRFERKPAVLVPRTADREAIKEALGNTPFNGPSPVWDAVVLALGAEKDRPGLVLLVANGLDNSSETSYDDVLKKVGDAQVPVVVYYVPANPPGNGENHLKKLAKSSSGKFIDLRVKDSWDQLLAALR